MLDGVLGTNSKLHDESQFEHFNCSHGQNWSANVLFNQLFVYINCFFFIFSESPYKLTSDSDITCLANRKNHFENGTLSEEDRNQGLDWDEKTRGLVLGAFFIGYVSTQVRNYFLCRNIDMKP